MNITNVGEREKWLDGGEWKTDILLNYEFSNQYGNQWFMMFVKIPQATRG